MILRSVCVCLCAYLCLCASVVMYQSGSPSVFFFSKRLQVLLGLSNYCVPVPVSASGCILKPRPTCALKLRGAIQNWRRLAVLGTSSFWLGVTLCPWKHLKFRFTTQAQQSENHDNWENMTFAFTYLTWRKPFYQVFSLLAPSYTIQTWLQYYCKKPPQSPTAI